MINIVYFLLRKFSRNSWMKSYMVVLVLFSLIIFVQCTSIKSLVTELDNLNSVTHFRAVEINVEKSEDINKIKKLSYVNDIMKVTNYASNVSSVQFKGNKTSGDYVVSGIRDVSELKVISGTKKGELGEKSIICPKYFSPGSYIDITSFLDEEIDVVFKGENKNFHQTFKLEGIYQNNKLINDNNMCYINKQVFDNISDSLYDNTTYDNFIVVLNDYRNVKYFNAYLENNNVRYQNLLKFNPSDYYSYIFILLMVVAVFIVGLVVVLNAITNKVIKGIYNDANFIYTVENNKRDLAVTIGISFVIYWIFVSIILLFIIMCFNSIIVGLSDYFIYMFQNKVIEMDFLAYFYSIFIILIMILFNNNKLIKEANRND